MLRVNATDDGGLNSPPNRSIVLPYDRVFRNLRNAKRFAVDIGGSLAKLAYSSTVVKHRSPAMNKSNSAKFCGVDSDCEEVAVMRLHFIKFETKYIESCLEFIKGKLEPSSVESGELSLEPRKSIKTTGGGAYKYFDLIRHTLGTPVDKVDEMECLIKGLNFLLRNIPDESFTYHHHNEGSSKYKFQTVHPLKIFPYLLVNIGSGVSCIKVKDDLDFERIGGTSFGGGTFWGLGSQLTDAKDFEELILLTEKGDHRNVDMLVSDIYGGAYKNMGLPGDLIASSYAKTVRSGKDSRTPEEQRRQFQEADKARSLLLLISNCIGQIAVLYAQQHSLTTVYFGGYFIRNHPITMRTISYAIDYWSKGGIRALFLRHEGYLGAIGAFLTGAQEDSRCSSHAQLPIYANPSMDASTNAATSTLPHDVSSRLSWREQYAESPALLLEPVPSAFQSQCDINIDSLVMDCTERNLVPLPLLTFPYKPDTVDLVQDKEARDYWLTCLENGVVKSVKKAIESQPSSSDATERAMNFQHHYIKHIQFLKQRPFAYGCLNVRSLLDLNEQLLNEFYFPDAYIHQKRLENNSALSELGSVLSFLDSLPPGKQRYLEAVRGALAGNVFDWGAQEVVKLLEGKKGLSFTDARNHLQARPWLRDDFEAWWLRITLGPPHQCALVFVDNSGADLILGILPFCRELLVRGTKVILSANSGPALNDVTAVELTDLFESGRIADVSDELGKAYKDGRLVIAENGQASPCLDLNRIDGRLCELVRDFGVDLVVIEGMGRAIHTNYDARFSCDSLKMAVVKNEWLANRLGGKTFSVIFKYETPMVDQNNS